MIRISFMFILLTGCMLTGFSQHNHDMDMNMDMDDSSMPSMSNSFSRNLPMNRNGSGTGWLPDAAPMFGSMIHTSKWMYMIHGSAFIRYNSQDFTKKGTRGNDKWDAPNWLMFMGQRQVGKKGLFHFSSMLSLDAAIAGSGYPLLFQTGESYRGKPLIDRQHPHDLFSELAVSYSYAINQKIDAFAYLGYPGEPALGPVTFMHRPSALDNPNAPISHHWVDATHITFGVATLGVRAGKFKLEGSLFTGREPDEHRYDLDKPLFNSWSGRLSFNPDKHWALQVSHGYVKSPEALHPDENIYKTTASAIFNTTVVDGSYFSGTALWGMNKEKGSNGENAAMLEGSWRFKKNNLYARYEFTQKSAEELVLDEQQYNAHSKFNVNELTIGYNRDFVEIRKIRIAAGLNYAVNHAPASLDMLYGKNPSSIQVYLRIYPSMM
jgi:hypothetical protein